MRTNRTELLPRMDPSIREIVLRAGRGKVNPVGFKDLPLPTGLHNPYWWFVLSAIAVALGGFVSWQVRASPMVSIAVLVVTVAIGLALAAWTARRTPAWHRARRDVQAWLREHPGELPDSLRWFG